jgi:hypothetical protein
LHFASGIPHLLSIVLLVTPAFSAEHNHGKKKPHKPEVLFRTDGLKIPHPIGAQGLGEACYNVTRLCADSIHSPRALPGDFAGSVDVLHQLCCKPALNSWGIIDLHGFLGILGQVV